MIIMIVERGWSVIDVSRRELLCAPVKVLVHAALNEQFQYYPFVKLIHIVNMYAYYRLIIRMSYKNQYVLQINIKLMVHAVLINWANEYKTINIIIYNIKFFNIYLIHINLHIVTINFDLIITFFTYINCK